MGSKNDGWNKCKAAGPFKPLCQVWTSSKAAYPNFTKTCVEIYILS